MVVLVEDLGFSGWMWSLIFSFHVFFIITDPIMGFISDNTKSKWKDADNMFLREDSSLPTFLCGNYFFRFLFVVFGLLLTLFSDPIMGFISDNMILVQNHHSFHAHGYIRYTKQG